MSETITICITELTGTFKTTKWLGRCRESLLRRTLYNVVVRFSVWVLPFRVGIGWTSNERCSDSIHISTYWRPARALSFANGAFIQKVVISTFDLLLIRWFLPKCHSEPAL